MKSVAVIRTQAVYDEKERIIKAFASDPHGEHRAVTKVAKSVLLNAPYLLNGLRWDVIAKSLGAGVYSLKLKLLK